MHILDQQDRDIDGLMVLFTSGIARLDALFVSQLDAIQQCLIRAQHAVNHAVRMYAQVTELDDGKTRERVWPRPRANDEAYRTGTRASSPLRPPPVAVVGTTTTSIKLPRPENGSTLFCYLTATLP